MIKEYEIDSVPDLVNTCIQIVKQFKCHPSDVWYRGIKNESMRLIPGVLWRGLDLNTEQSIIAEFNQYHSLYSDRSESNPLKLYTTMQHYGLPTRLLDWSLSPLIALYFSLENELSDSDNPVIWAILPNALNNISENYNGILAPNDFCGSMVDKYLPSYFTDIKTPTPSSVISLYAPLNNPRVRAQKGCFTLHGFDSKPIDDIYTESAPSCIAKIKVKNINRRTNILSELFSIGIKEDDIYQDLNYLSKRIIREFGI